MAEKKPVNSRRFGNTPNSYNGFSLYVGFQYIEFLVYLYRRHLAIPIVKTELFFTPTPTDICLPEDLYELKLSINSLRKEIGNIEINAILNFFDPTNQKSITLPLQFENALDVIESLETATLKCQTKILPKYCYQNSMIKLTVNYDYMFLGKNKTVTHRSTWRLSAVDDRPSLQLIS